MGWPLFQVIVGGRDVTGLCRGLQFSNTDPGGMESAQLSVVDPRGVKTGDPVRIYFGIDCLFWGEVNDPGDQISKGASNAVIVAHGAGKVFQENAYGKTYVHQKLSDWKDRREETTTTLGSGQAVEAGVISSDGGLQIGLSKGYVVAVGDVVGVMLDAGPNDKWRRMVFSGSTSNNNNSGAPGLWVQMYSGNYPSGSGAVSIYGPAAFTTMGATFTNQSANPTGRYIFINVEGSGAGTMAADGWVKFSKILAVTDNTYESANVSVFDPTRLFLDTLKRVEGGIVPGQIDDGRSFPIQHLANPFSRQVPAEWANLAAKLMGYHWGVWEPAGLSDRPRAWFAAVPKYATGAVDWSKCREGDAPRMRYDQLYDSCVCTYTDVYGSTQTVTVTKPIPYLTARVNRTLEVNMGTGTAAAAQIYAGFALTLAQSTARGSGSCILPPVIDTPKGPMPSVLLKAGRDRIRLRGIMELTNLLDDDTRRVDTFHVRRIEVIVQESGEPQVRCEFDGGGDLMEILDARASMNLTAAGVS